MLCDYLQASAAPPPKFMILEYKYVPDILEKRTPHRAAHLAAAQAKVCPLAPPQQPGLASS